MSSQRDVLVLFDVDGTLTPSRLVIKPDMKQFLLDLKKKVVIGKKRGLRACTLIVKKFFCKIC